MSKSTPVPLEHIPSSHEQDVRKTPELELHHVRDVYDKVATQWYLFLFIFQTVISPVVPRAGTRYKAWPEVERFLDGKYLFFFSFPY